METYTAYITAKGDDISPEDDNYRQELLDAAKSFRTFDAALDEFIQRQGYLGDIGDTEAKVRFLKERFDEAGVPVEARIFRGWYRNHTQPEKRDIAIGFCFAFHLTLEQTRVFFQRVYLLRGLDCHNVEEIIYYYCLCHGLSYGEAQTLIEKAPKQDGKGHIDFSGEVLYTGTILQELERFQSPEALLTFLHDHSAQFAYSNVTAKRYIARLWKQIAGEKGLAYREICHSCPENAVAYKPRSVWAICRQILGLLEYDEKGKTIPYRLEGDRSIQAILGDNVLIHPIVRRCFPDRQGLEDILKGEYRSEEVIRKTLILLAFYHFWAELLLKQKSVYYVAKPDDGPRCIASINHFLIDASYPELYAGNPYDWIFWTACYDSDPLNAFRSFMRAAYFDKKESGGLQ